jgi:hypothetical protein
MLKRRTRDLVQLFTAPIPTSRSTACIVEEYRTVSYQIAESKEKDAAELKKAKDTAAKGMLRTTILSLYR